MMIERLFFGDLAISAMTAGVLEQVSTPRLYFVLNGKAVWPGNLPANFQAR